MKEFRLDDQLCFPIYALSRQIISLYRPYLDEVDLTYPQYLVLMLLWEQPVLSVKELGDRLLLDSGTLTPLLKRLEQKKLVSRKRNEADERSMLISLTKEGSALKRQLSGMPAKAMSCLGLKEKEVAGLRDKLHQLINSIQESQV